jgi:hypothetical protein
VKGLVGFYRHSYIQYELCFGKIGKTRLPLSDCILVYNFRIKAIY